jgi:hypothetical protein
MVETASYLSFLVRLWREIGPEEPGLHTQWRGEIEHIQSGRKWAFDSLDELLGFLRRQTENSGGWIDRRSGER